MIDTQAIRTRILHLALQGKLVPQNSSDDSAIDLVSALCKKIKDQSFQNNISQQEIPYNIPDSWVWCRLSDIGTTNIGLTYHPEDVSANGTIVARSSNIVNNKMDYTDLVKVNCPIRDNQFLNTNDILICARNGSKALVGKCAIFEGTSKTVAFGAFMAVFRTPLYRFVYYYFNSQVFKRNFFNDESKQINQVTQNILKKSLIPIPPIHEQERITRKIEQAFSVLDTIDELQAQYANNLTALKSKLIDAAIQGKLTEQLPEDGTTEELYQQIQEEKQKLIKEGKIKKQKPLPEIPDDEIPFDIPKNWKWVRLGSVANVLGGKRIPAGRTLTTEDTGYKYIRVSEMKNGTVNTENLLFVPEDIYPSISQYIIKKEDVYITVAGTIGRVGKIPEEIDGANLTENADRIVLFSINQDWLIQCLSSTVVQKQIEKLTTSVAQPKLAIKRIQAFSIPLPPFAEQKRIVQKLDEILPLCEIQK